MLRVLQCTVQRSSSELSGFGNHLTVLIMLPILFLVLNMCSESYNLNKEAFRAYLHQNGSREPLTPTDNERRSEGQFCCAEETDAMSSWTLNLPHPEKMLKHHQASFLSCDLWSVFQWPNHDRTVCFVRPLPFWGDHGEGQTQASKPSRPD